MYINFHDLFSLDPTFESRFIIVGIGSRKTLLCISVESHIWKKTSALRFIVVESQKLFPFESRIHKNNWIDIFIFRNHSTYNSEQKQIINIPFSIQLILTLNSQFIWIYYS